MDELVFKRTASAFRAPSQARRAEGLARARLCTTRLEPEAMPANTRARVDAISSSLYATLTHGRGFLRSRVACVKARTV